MAQIVAEHREDLQRGRITAVSSGGSRVESADPTSPCPAKTAPESPSMTLPAC